MQRNPSDDDIESWTTGRLLSAAARLLEHEFNADLARWGLNHAGLAVLHVLSTGPMTQRQIATKVQVEDQTMSRTLDRLERSGYVERRRDAGDRRRVVVSLTAAGRKTWMRAADVGAAESYFRDVSDDLEVLRRSLIRIIRGRSLQRWPHLGEPRADTAAPDRTSPDELAADQLADEPADQPASAPVSRDVRRDRDDAGVLPA